MERFLNILDGNVKEHPSCFYLSWKNRTAEWCNAKDHQSAPFRALVKWRDFKRDILIAADEPPGVHLSSTSPPLKPSHIAYLKSHLQKSIRLSNSYRAILTAFELISADTETFLRRLLIIAIEDALPLDGYAVLTWFMAAHSKGYYLKEEQVEWCMKYVYDLAKCPHYEQISPEPNLPVRPDGTLFNLPPEGKNLVYSLLFRETYGGLEHDTALCRKLAELWTCRYNTGSLHLKTLNRNKEGRISTSKIIRLNLRDWYLSAIDYHTCPNLIGFLREKNDNYSEKDIKSAIWHFSSSLTNKKNIGIDYQLRGDQSYGLIWKEIKKSVQSYAWHMLNVF
jgi:hypothetical protein